MTNCYFKKLYQQKKAEARAEAQEWQENAIYMSTTWGGVASFYDHFYKLGKRYGLLKEFKENGII